MDQKELKQKICAAIDESRSKILEVREDIYRHPEFGYKETHTTSTVADFMKRELGLSVEQNIAVTGCKAVMNGTNPGPCIAVLGEMDGISCKEHEDALENGASHTCGHCNQIAGMLGAALGLIKSGAFQELCGRVMLLAVPAEEFIELNFRQKLREEGTITYFGGKQELIKKGYFDDVDMAMMFHSMDMGHTKAMLNMESNGFIGKNIHFKGREAHAGDAPYNGVNALNAAALAINNVHALRETFRESERVRFHPIITKGGDIVNVVPADVKMESYVRARTMGGMLDANQRINTALLAGGLAVGADVEITDIPGYLPLLKQPKMYALLKGNLLDLGLDTNSIQDSGEATSSYDFGDLCHIMPAIHPMFGGVTGALHTREFMTADPELAILIPAKAMAMTIVDLLCDGAEEANRLLADFKPVMTKEEYLDFLKSTDRTTALKDILK